jgi:hypothetical protein
MTQDDTITPFIDLVKQWSDDWHKAKDNDFDLVLYVALQATRWGADQELEACCEWIPKATPWDAEKLRAARRPKPLSLKEQALQALYRFDDTEGHKGLTPEQIAEDFVLIRRALESLPD